MSDQPIASPFTFEIEHEDGVAYVRCHGKLISGVGNPLYTKVSKLMPGSKRIVLDLADVTYMDSLGLGTLVRLYVSAKSAGCSLELYHIGKRIREMLGVTHLLGVFTVIGEHGTIIRF
jgi:anti-sigma B factor antagonist